MREATGAVDRALDALDRFIADERTHLAVMLGEGVQAREDRFLHLAHAVVRDASDENVRALLSEFAGIGHYFGAYARDLRRLDELTDELYRRTGELAVAMRAVP